MGEIILGSASSMLLTGVTETGMTCGDSHV